VSINLFVGVGSRYESDEVAGVSHLIEHLVFKGTESRPGPSEISGPIEGVGGVLNAGTEQELTVYWCKIAQPFLRDSLDLLLDMVRNSVYATDDIERERMVVVEEQNMINDQPDYKVEALMDNMLWPDHPLGRDVSGTRASVMSLTKAKILEHVSQFYTPSNMVISIAGNVEHEEVVDQINEFSTDWKSTSVPGWQPFTRQQTTSNLRLEYRKSEQVHLGFGLPSVSAKHPDQYAVDLISVVLGEGMSSRLFLEVREKRGLAYDVHSGITHLSDSGAFLVNAGVDPKRVYDAVDTILAELGRLRDGIPLEELERAKRLTKGRMMLTMEETKAVSAWIGSQELLLGEVLTVDEVVQKLDAVTTDDVHRVANDLLHTEKLNLAIVGPCRGKVRLERLLKL
jgi:predicted Zn-dependent peptidase